MHHSVPDRGHRGLSVAVASAEGVMSAEDLAALLPPAPATPVAAPGGGAGDRQGSDQKRRKLRHYDLLPSQLLNSLTAIELIYD